MKKIIILAVIMLGITCTISAETNTQNDSTNLSKEQIAQLMEQAKQALDTLNTYQVVNDDNTLTPISTEYGILSKHLNLGQRIAREMEKIGDWAGIGGLIFETIGVLGNNVGTVLDAFKILNTADNLSSIAGHINNLSSFIGMDVTFDGKSSTNNVAIGKEGIRILVNSPLLEDPTFDSMASYRVIHLDKDKKSRWFRVWEYEPALIESGKYAKKGYVNFKAAKFKERQAIINIPASSLKKGEQYAVVFMNVMATTIPVATFVAE